MQIDDIRHMQLRQEQLQETTVRTSLTPKEEKGAATDAFNVRLGESVMPQASPAYSKNQLAEEGLLDEIADSEAHFTDATAMKRELSMAAAGFTPEDFDEAKKEGYDVKNLEPREIVTVTDQIKMQLLKAGKDISPMGGLSSSEIEVMAGSAGLAATLERELAAADLPSDEATVADAVTAVREAGELAPLTEQTMQNLLVANAEPTIDNLYRAEFGGSGTRSLSAPTVDDEAMREMEGQIARVLEEAGLPKDDRQMENARMLLDEQLPVTAENLSYLNTLQTKELMLSPRDVHEAVLTAVSEGKNPREATLIEGYSMKDKAQEAVAVVMDATEEQAREVAREGRMLTVSELRRRQAIEGQQADVAAARKSDGAATFGEPGIGNAARADMMVPGTIDDAEKAGIATDGVATIGGETPAILGGEVPAGWTAEEVRAARVLEEARLVMTQEANLSLLRQGISIDTTELSALVDKLREQENVFYKTMLGTEGEVSLEEKIARFEMTRETVASLQEMPAALLGRIPEGAQASLSRLHEEGAGLQARMNAAGERYEVMRTEVRRDLGDSIRKAFRNVDDILSDIGLEGTEANERAVRILGYNELEITPESVATMREADEQVQRAFKNLTPAVVARMIRDGENPLDLSIGELNEKAEAIKAVGSQASEGDFADFLWKAEQNGDITDEERAGMMGVYRLIYQVEKSDGAVIGQLLNQGSEVTLRNMMGAVRTRRHENREYTVDDDFGFAEFDKDVLSITDQIEMAFQTARMKDAKDAITPGKMARFENQNAYLAMSPDRFAAALEQMDASEADEAAAQELAAQNRESIKEAIDSEQRVYDILNRFDLPQSPANLEAMTQLLKNRNDMYRRLFGKNERRTFGDEAEIAADKDIRDVMEDVMEAFGEAAKTPEEMAEAQRKLEDIATNVMKGMLMEREVGSIDVRGMQVAIRQLQAVGEMGRRSETYAIPITVKDGTGNLSLKIVRGKEEDRGIVDVALSTERLGNIFASFRYTPQGVEGTVTSDTPATREELMAQREAWVNAIAERADAPVRISFGFDARTDANAIFDETRTDFETTTERTEVQTRVLYDIARGAIEAFSSL